MTILFDLHIDPNILNVRFIQLCCRVNLRRFRNSVLSILEINQFSNSQETFQESFCQHFRNFLTVLW